MPVYKLFLHSLYLSLSPMKKTPVLYANHLTDKKRFPNKWLFILIHGCLLRGGLLSLVTTLLITLSYSSFAFNAYFFNHFALRLLPNSCLLMLGGIGLGHWLWVAKGHQEKLKALKILSKTT